jgi:hypothetical protein
MLTLLVIAFDVFALIWSGGRILRKSKEINYQASRFLAWGLILVGIAIFLYGLRSIVVQFGPSFYWMDEYIFYRPGTVIHSIGLLLAFWFVYKEFTPKTFAKITVLPVLGSLFYLVYIFAFSPVNRVVKQAPLEPIKFIMTNYPWAQPLVARLFLYITVGAPLVILGIFIYNALKTERLKALLFGLGIPIISFLGIVGVWKPGMLPLRLSGGVYKGLFALAIILILSSLFVSKDRKLMRKALLYGLGISFEGLFIPLCIFVSPIFARLGYGVGALMVYKAFGIKVE